MKLLVAVAGIFVTGVLSTQASADSFWDHNGSVMRLVSNGNNREFYYEVPRESLLKHGVVAGTLFFDGTRDGNRYVGTARAFNSECSTPAMYQVLGVVEDEKTIVLKGDRSIYLNCKPTAAHRLEELTFTYLGQKLSTDECSGILHLKDGLLYLDNGRGGEGICAVKSSEQNIVLGTCNLEHFCKVEGVLGSCGDSSECIEISAVTGVAKK